MPQQCNGWCCYNYCHKHFGEMLLSRADGNSSVSEETSAVALLESINTEHMLISITNLLGRSLQKGLVSIGSVRCPPVPYHYNEHASWCQAGIVSCRDRRTAYAVTLVKLGSPVSLMFLTTKWELGNYIQFCKTSQEGPLYLQRGYSPRDKEQQRCGG